jgi:tetratricopeptide (TPR) repeat protein
MRRIVLAAALLIALGAAGTASAQSAGEREDKARAALAAGQYEAALAAYEQLYVETNRPAYLREIGRCYQFTGQPDKAIRTYRTYLERAPKLSAAERTEVDGDIAQMEALKASRAQDLAPPAVNALPDGAAAAPAAPAVAAPRAPAASPLPMLDGQTPAVSATPAPAPTERPFHETWWFWTAVGALVVGTIVVIGVSRGGTSTPDSKLGDMEAFTKK